MPKAGVKKLRNLRVGEISPVPDGANEGAAILIRKAKDRGFTPCEDCPNEAACRAKGKCAIETPAKGAGKGEKSAVKKGLEIALATTEAFIAKAGDAAPPGEMVGIDVAKAAIEHGFEKAAQTFEELIGTREQSERLRVGVGALNQSIWSIQDDPNNAANAPALIAKTVMQFGAWLMDEFDLSEVAKAADEAEAEETAKETAEDTVAGGSGDDAGETGIGKSGDEAMPKDLEEAINKAKALEEENTVLKARMSRLEEAEAERIIEKAADTMAKAAGRLVLPADKLRTVVKQLDAEGCQALGEVLKAAGAQAATSGMFTTFGKSGEGGSGKVEGGDAPVGLIEKAKARREALLKGAGRA